MADPNDRRIVLEAVHEGVQRARGAVTAAHAAFDHLAPPLDLRQPFPEAVDASLRHAREQLDELTRLTRILYDLEAGIGANGRVRL